jgi:hypothetical protein
MLIPSLHAFQVGSVDVNDVLALGKQATRSNRRILDIFRMHLPEVERRAAFVKSHPPATPDEAGFYGGARSGHKSTSGGGAADDVDVESEV